jgi:hypothetical protein
MWTSSVVEVVVVVVSIEAVDGCEVKKVTWYSMVCCKYDIKHPFYPTS